MNTNSLEQNSSQKRLSRNEFIKKSSEHEHFPNDCITPRLKLSNCVILKQISDGYFSQVYLTYEMNEEKFMALKIFNKSLLEEQIGSLSLFRPFAEKESLKDMAKSLFVPHVLFAGTDKKKLYLATSLENGDDLRTFIYAQPEFNNHQIA
ncbi:hypothetical protein SNEBB_003918, partial [Seison nebaliae]